MRRQDQQPDMSKFSAYPMAPHDRPYGYEKVPADYHGVRIINEYRPYQQPERRDEANDNSRPYMRSSEDHLRRFYEPTYTRSQEQLPRPEPSHSASATSLPPLSSIFAEPRRDAPRPTYYDRSSSFSTAPQGHRRAPTPPRHERGSWEAAVSSHAQAPVHFSQELRYAPTSKAELPPPSTAMPTARPAVSPAFQDPRYSPKETPRAPLPTSAWSPRSDAPFHDYFSAGRDTSSSFRPQLDSHHSMPVPSYIRESEARANYQTASPATPTLPPTPGSTIVSEPITVKDGLGPKIWTGTQFLPRFIRQAEVPGEGMCYFYDDGTHCKTHIDGEPVNAHWGVTKAGKPRKRLAIACITCRDKKIKCDPDYPKCVQCDKFGRICRFKNAPRGGQASLENSPLVEADEITRRQTSTRSIGSDAGSSYKLDRSVHSNSPRTFDHSSPDRESFTSKRRKFNDDLQPARMEQKHVFHNTSPPATQWASAAALKHKEPLTLKWPNNPYEADPFLVMELAKVYFSNIASTAYSFLSEQPFMNWLASPEAKSTDDILLIYAVLTVATIWSPMKSASKLGFDLSKIARFASQGGFSLQVVQARHLFALYFEHIGELDRSWDFLGSALRAAVGSGLHLEVSPSSGLDLTKLPLGLSKGGYAETRRRTFWSCYIMDRLGSFRSGRLSNISVDDIFLRMPCDNLSFRQQKELANPYFATDLDLEYVQEGTFGIMSYLIIICTIYGDIMGKSWRAEQGMKITNLEDFYLEAEKRLEKFIKSLPPCIAHSLDNVNKTAEFGLLGSFAAIHTVYRASMVKLNSSSALQVPGIVDNNERFRIATKQAEALVRETGLLSGRSNRSIAVNEQACGNVPSFIGTAVLDAMRFLGERVACIPGVEDAKEVILDLSKYWPSACT